MGVWIETTIRLEREQILGVTPFVGVWIETAKANDMRAAGLSHTLRGCVD